MPFNHVGLSVPASKLEPLLSWLQSSLKHMGFKEHHRVMDVVVGLGEERDYFWLSGFPVEGVDDQTHQLLFKTVHLAFDAQNFKQVDQFYEAAIQAGGTDNGAPGHRPMYGEKYYAAFVRDPACGINFEVVCKTGNSA